MPHFRLWLHGDMRTRRILDAAGLEGAARSAIEGGTVRALLGL